MDRGLQTCGPTTARSLDGCAAARCFLPAAKQTPRGISIPSPLGTAESDIIGFIRQFLFSMSTRSTTTPAKTEYTISFTIRDGDNEYEKECTDWFDHEPTEKEVIYSLVDLLRYEDGDLAKQQAEAWKQYQQNRHLEIPGDYRIVDDIGWEKDNTRLIAAAPELLEACRIAVNALNQIPNRRIDSGIHKNTYSVCSMLDKIIAAAEGRD